MRRIAFAAVLAAAAVAMPAQANNGQANNGHANQQAGSHRCTPHKVAWLVRGTVVTQALTPNDDGTYSGDVVVTVKRTNRHARAETADPQPKTYTLDHARVRFGVSDQEPADGTVDQGDVVAGDRVQLRGKITKLRRRCDQSGFTAETTIRRVVFHDPRPPQE
jgi:hypothetical protein